MYSGRRCTSGSAAALHHLISIHVKIPRTHLAQLIPASHSHSTLIGMWFLQTKQNIFTIFNVNPILQPWNELACKLSLSWSWSLTDSERERERSQLGLKVIPIWNVHCTLYSLLVSSSWFLFSLYFWIIEGTLSARVLLPTQALLRRVSETFGFWGTRGPLRQVFSCPSEKRGTAQ